MTLTIQIEPGTGVAIAKGSGVLHLGDARAGATALWKDPDWPGGSVVWDFREAQFDLSSSDIREIAHFISRYQPSTPPSRVAFVTARDVDFGLVRMFEVYREDPRTSVRVFRDFDEAAHWARSAAPSTD